MEILKNKVTLTGLAGTDPLILNLSESKKMARVSIAVNEFYKNSEGEPVNQTQWFNLVFWNKKVDLVENVITKGTAFSIEGKLNTRSFTDKKGDLRFSTEIVVTALKLVSKDGHNFLAVQ